MPNLTRDVALGPVLVWSERNDGECDSEFCVPIWHSESSKHPE